ncbi:hypothetical protein EV213_10593 [Aureibacillus halotolerans]|uniref:Uncharacterized protein n=1 Tax=Aureibacillus halotolerans TaxID=1508390 RepID=A0A4V3D5N2_9BACI|nr:hypothetical protein EV213_10593 [Aureibacillus halotolerans]
MAAAKDGKSKASRYDLKASPKVAKASRDGLKARP